MVNTSNARNSIKVFDDDQGRRLEDKQAIVVEVVKFYKILLGTMDTSVQRTNIYSLQIIIDFKLSLIQKEVLIKSVYFEDIKDALLSMGEDKAPGPDGFNVLFFKVTWNILGLTLQLPSWIFCSSGRLVEKSNSTRLVLVPKVPNARKIIAF